MKIAYFIHHSGIKAGGAHTYSLGILNLLIETKDISKILLVYSNDQKDDVKKYFSIDKIEPVLINRSKKFIRFRVFLSIFLQDMHLLYKQHVKKQSGINLLMKLSLFINPYKKLKKFVDIIHVPYQYSSIYRAGIPVITTLHDIQELHYPEFFTAEERLHRAVHTKKAIDESDHIIVSFNHIKKDIIDYFSVPEDKIDVCMPPVNVNWFSKSESTSFIDLKDKYRTPDKFLLYPAATWQHKNHIAIIRAMEILKEKGIDTFLVSTGNRTEHFDKIEKEIKKLNLEDSVLFTGIIPEEDLIGFYKTASLVVIPTKYEAGSGPLFEAIKYSAPAVASNVTSIPETMNDERFIFDPDDYENIAHLIDKILNNEDFRKANLDNLKQRLSYYESKNYRKQFVSVYKKLLDY